MADFAFSTCGNFSTNFIHHLCGIALAQASRNDASCEQSRLRLAWERLHPYVNAGSKAGYKGYNYQNKRRVAQIRPTKGSARSRRIELALLVASLCASAMFKCQARDGAISYTSQAIANARCTRLNGMAGTGVGAKAMALPRLVRDDDSGAVRIRVFTFLHKGIRQYVSRRPVGISARVDVLEL